MKGASGERRFSPLSGLRARSRVPTRWGQLKSGEQGAAILEFALSIMILLTLVIGVMETAFAFYFYNVISEAAREGSRYAAVRGAEWGTGCDSSGYSYGSYSCTASAADVTNYIENLGLPGISSSSLGPNGISVVWAAGPNEASCHVAGCNGTGDQTTVTISYTFNVPMPFMPPKAVGMSSRSTMTVLY